ncbi:KilA-N domain-containing protein [Methanoregula sp.]|uniref:KilA-N domain-containing protein n=1 Tax=Methanoregula sp. TaxID=2052170 RepID=UPI0025F06D11|nr:KilA-N domain-containing protein [Methanoregula sp.]
MTKLNVLDKEVAIFVQNDEDYICITDIARYKNPDSTDDLICSWIRNRNTIEFPGIWEQLNNPDFNPAGFDGFGEYIRETGRDFF